ncbi:UvrD-helicase domain-containing protein [Nocardioides zhouii]|uniref:DNA 3'-5' helicase n=1 Tax=Nocardioides zhouii TaxID=1168729 RepID=A0A4Q2SJB3_9ACTN|nr:UvrD-helicase domain-containing protein [Nocardioides zhouii]RYC05655.1 DNA helicase UvrD [Nocardioides zhouii]
MTDPVDQDERDRIKTHTDRTLFVRAGAGSGKTSSLVARVAQLVLQDGVEMERVATVTFTIKAAAELRDRLRARFERALAEESDPEPLRRAEVALEQLDLAAIGTLHSFAQRILTAHPIEAGTPPALDVLDEVGSSIAFEERWARIQRDLLDDEELADALTLGISAGIQLKHVRQTVRLLGQDWDRLRTHVLSNPPKPLSVPGLDDVEKGLNRVLDLRACCIDPSDKLFPVVEQTEALLRALLNAADVHETMRTFPALAGFKTGNVGTMGSWSGIDPKAVRDSLREVVADAMELKAKIVAQCLRHITYWCAHRVLAEATERRRSGRLEFHDLLVLARDLLARDEDVRDTLHQTYERLLLDEFQDTDPIQIEIAVRIAGGRDASQPDWRDVTVPDGRLFVVGDAKQSIYRFRRASIKTYLGAQGVIGEPASLSTNFRSVPGVVKWVNGVFCELITFQQDAQPTYEPLVAHRDTGDKLIGPAVMVSGVELHPETTADGIRAAEATDAAGAIAQVITEGWTVFDQTHQLWRPAQLADIAVLLPSRTSMSRLEDALDTAGIPFRAESMSLVYEAAEVRDLLIIARAIADPSDQLALVIALRTPAMGCGDDDLLAWRHGGRWLDLHSKVADDQLSHTPVGVAMDYLHSLERAARWLTPSEVLAKIVADRRFLELSAYQPRTRDSWRRIRFLVDQARAWSEVSHGGLRAYLDWVAHQAQEKARVSEAILPERDSDAVRVMTIHAAKGLEFPIVVLSGMSNQPRTQYGVRLLWGDADYTVSFAANLREVSFEEAAELDEQMDDYERIRLMYVGATRARDHLIVSMHRTDRTSERLTPAELLAHAQAHEVAAPQHFVWDGEPRPVNASSAAVTPPPDFDTWLAGVTSARRASRMPGAITASGPEGTDPEVVLAEADAGLAKGPRDVELPPWSKGRYGSAVGRAVHAALQTVDLATGSGLEQAVRAQVIAEAIPEHEDVVARLVRSALTSETVQRAAARTHWREAYVGAPGTDGVLVEGIIDLIYEEDDKSLVVVDYKTDVVRPDTLTDKVAFYTPQLRAYRDMLTAATGRDVKTLLLFLHPEGSYLADL